MSLDQKKELVEQIYVRSPRIRELLTKMKHCLEYSRIAAEPQCMVIKGPLGSGKTTLIKDFVRDYQRSRTEERTLVPVLVVTIPVPATVKGFVTEILAAFGDKAYNKGTQTSQTIRVRGYIEDCETQFLIFDEFQHFIDRESLKVLKTLSDWLKNLIDKTKRPILVVGMPSCDAVLDEPQNEQLKRRFSIRESLEPFGWKTKQQRKEFRSFLDLLDEQLPLLGRSRLADFNTAYLIHRATDGTIAYVMKLIRAATVLALGEGIEKLDLDLLAQAYEEHLADNNPAMANPFVITADSRKKRRVKKAATQARTTNRRVRARKNELTASDVLKRH